MTAIQRDARELIDKSKYVSFDIFDTAVLRPLQKPIDVFELVEESYKTTYGGLSFDYKTVRVEYERKAREKAWNLKKHTEIILDEIYQCMEEDLDIGYDILEKLKRIEIETETKVCTRNPFIYSLYSYCIEKKKEVVFISDMYLPLDTIIKILQGSGYDKFNKVLLSSSLGITKSTGELYELLIRELSCKPQEILHIGDNYDSDVTVAEKYGLITYFYDKCINAAHGCRDLREDLLNGFITKKNTIEESIYIATVANKCYANRDSKSTRSENDFWYDFGYKYVGILFFAFNNWLSEQAAKDKVEKLYFLSRDGYIMKQVYDSVSQLVENIPPSEYMYASRRALNLPGIIELDDQTLDFLVSGTSTLKVSQFLERIGLNPMKFTEAIREAGFSTKDDKVITGSDYGNLRKLFLLITDDITKIADAERKLIYEYFKNIGIFDAKKIGVVDIGWHGTLQHSISKIMKLFGKGIEIKGYYLGTFSKAFELHKAGHDMSAYLCEYGRPENYHDFIKLCVEIFEFIHTAPHGSAINFKKMNGKIEPVLEQNDFEAKKIEKANALQRGALDFIEDLVSLFKHFKFLGIPKELAVKPLYRVLKNPTYEEAVNLGNLEHAEGFGDVYVKRYIAKPSGFIRTLVNPYIYSRECSQAFWKIGYKKRFFSLNRIFKNKRV